MGGIRYCDGQVDDARHTMMIARTARRYGAVCVTSARVTRFLREGDRVTGTVVRDLEGGGEIQVRASKCIHVVVPRDRIHATVGLISRTDRSVLFIIPWGSHWIIGTTDTDWDLDLAHPAASRSDIDYLLDHVNRLLSTPLTHEDIQGVYAGLRPLLQGESDVTSRLSREHAIVTPAAGLTLVAGGKYTTYRVMAKDAVDAAVAPEAPECCTDRVPLLGAEGFTALWNSRERLAAESGVQVAQLEGLLRRYGTLVTDVLRLIAEHAELGWPLAGASDYLPSRRTTAPATRVPRTSMTCSPDGCGSPSRSSTAV